MDFVTFLVLTGHLLLAAVWLGAMVYSIGVVQPRLLRFAGGPSQVEEVATYVAAGARWKVVGVIGGMAASGSLLVITSVHASHVRPGWWVVVALKVALLAIASSVFWFVSWRMWPRRVFALGSDLAEHQAAFRRVGYVLIALVGASSVLGVALRWLR